MVLLTSKQASGGGLFHSVPFGPLTTGHFLQYRCVDGSSLRFEWELDSVRTTVDIGLTAESGPGGDSGSTLLTLTQLVV